MTPLRGPTIQAYLNFFHTTAFLNITSYLMLTTTATAILNNAAGNDDRNYDQ